MMEALLSIKDLVKVYGRDTRALNGISLDFYPGEFIVVIGPSGAGKSTLIRCINRLVDPTEGAVVFDGQHMENIKGRGLREKRSKIGMIFQHYNLVSRTNVIKNVLHGQLSNTPLYKSLFGLYSQQDKQEAVELLKKVGLEDQIYKRADALSGGQMQRVGICRALLQRPKILLADEPIASLDPVSANIVMQQLHNISMEKQLTCVVNLHQVDYAKKYATRIVGIKKGQVVFDGPPANLTEPIVRDIYEGKETQMPLQNDNSVTDIFVNEDKQMTGAER
ncbi:phosphonate ABC transporter ATP-binding protein [Gracilibacillus salitolerans]|uniref:Phosphonate ABC transporter ATP-binding protein n=2 Tax=Gracilibacillus salitolerans TaxID=2663022 RepID=A0A5Q2TFE6_9BACI|nr:phosphonate ABC transporter ATP-binding protein [Gracilibacillus salitolerans]